MDFFYHNKLHVTIILQYLGVRIGIFQVMMQWSLCIALLICMMGGTKGQVLPASRSSDWTLAGLTDVAAEGIIKVDVTDFGADPSGSISASDAVSAAMASLNDGPGVIYFPEGTYLLDQAIILADSVVLRGEGADHTVLEFDLGGSGDLIQIIGNWGGNPDTLVSSADMGDIEIEMTDASHWQVGDMARLHKDDNDLVHDSWAFYSVAQIVRIVDINGNVLTLDQPLRTDFPLSRYSALRKIHGKERVGIECLKIKRLDATTSQSKNIHFRYATECWVRGVESDQCNFGHVVIDASSHVEVTGSAFHHAFDYGGGGKAYGVVLHGSASLCLVENNIFYHLRHSMLLQSGANGNVLSFNYSTDPFWTSFPNNSAGDLVCHGNYPFSNLFEHNIIQNIIIDNSHGANGPFNTFLRNRAELYGLVMTATNSPSQNYLGNEITGTGFGQGNYTLQGADHFEYGNSDNGTIIPAGTTALSDTSYFYETAPDFISSNLPIIGTPVPFNSNSIPARDRFLAGTGLTTCVDPCVKSVYHWSVWTGCAENSNWTDPGNWSNGSVPDDQSAVLISGEAEGGFYPILTGNVHIGMLDVEEGGRIEVPAGILLNVLTH